MSTPPLTRYTFLFSASMPTSPIARGILTDTYTATFPGGARVGESDTHGVPHAAAKPVSRYARGTLGILFASLAEAEAARQALSSGATFLWAETGTGIATDPGAVKRGPFVIAEGGIRVELTGADLSLARIEFDYQEVPA